MEVSGFWPVFGAGASGAVMLEILRWWKLRDPSELPAYRTSLFYWGITIVMICAGGLLATFYGLEVRNALMVANVGASAPALIGSLATAGSKKEERRTRSVDPAARSRAKYELTRRFLAFGR
jgi:hypothetical protein